MQDSLLESTYFRNELTTILASESDFENVRAKIVAQFAAALPTETLVVFYGCGQIARTIARHHGELFDGRNVTFATTNQPDSAGFEGYPWLSIDEAIAPESKKAVIILSATYANEMRAAVQGAESTQVYDLLGILQDNSSDQHLVTVIESLRATAQNIATELEEQFGDGEPPVFHGPSDNSPAFFEGIKKQNHQFAAVCPIRDTTQPLVLWDHSEWADYVTHKFTSFAYLLMLSHLFSIYRFKAVIIHHMGFDLRFNKLLAEQCISPLFIWHDSFLHLLCTDEKLCCYYTNELNLSADEIRDVEVEVFSQADGVITRYSEEVLSNFRQENGLEFSLLQTFIPMFKPPALQARPAIDQDRRLQVVFATGIYDIDDNQTTAYVWSRQDIIEAAELLDRQQADLTVYNYRDRGDGEFSELETYARDHANFSYNRAVPRDRLLEVLPEYDFGWMCRRFDYHPGHLSVQHVNTSLFTYVEAGVPVIMSKELEFMSRIVEEWGIGLTLGFDEWDMAGESARGFDFATYPGNALKAQALLDPIALGRDVGRFITDTLAHRDESATLSR